ncbi:hypothetical protein [Streptosporangium vulgare]|uniref:Uncharacterized protein n=1 Tax=Streptosporangium vulgare TaxID=46190 RepID=A0ABV5TTW6_9ACTN
MVGLVFGLAAGLTLGNHHAWPAYTIAVRRLAKKEHLLRKLMAFLDDAHRLGPLRIIGPSTSFATPNSKTASPLYPHRAASPQHQDPN